MGQILMDKCFQAPCPRQLPTQVLALPVCFLYHHLTPTLHPICGLWSEGRGGGGGAAFTGALDKASVKQN